MGNATGINEYRKNKLILMTKSEKQEGLSKFLENVKNLNLDYSKEIDTLKRIRGIK
ncbi:MAG: hypothetical protein ACRDA5_16410 [Clostridium sp.]